MGGFVDWAILHPRSSKKLRLLWLCIVIKHCCICRCVPILWPATEDVRYLPTLRLLFDGGALNDYRLNGDSVEFRTNEGPRRTLDDSDLAIHFRFDTEVARWLRRHSI